MKEFSEWRARPPCDMEMAEFWCSETAIHRFLIMRRLFLSFCSTRPDNAESERDFSAMTRLLSPLRRGRMRADTVEMFLYLNRKYWHPCDANKDKFYFKALLVSWEWMNGSFSSRTATTRRSTRRLIKSL